MAYSVATKSNKVIFISTSGGPSVNWIDLQALNKVGPTGSNQVLDPLAMLNLDNWLFM